MRSAIIFLSGRHAHGKLILRRWQGTRRKGRKRTRRIHRAVEIEHDFAVPRTFGVQKPRRRNLPQPIHDRHLARSANSTHDTINHPRQRSFTLRRSSYRHTPNIPCATFSPHSSLSRSSTTPPPKIPRLFPRVRRPAPNPISRPIKKPSAGPTPSRSTTPLKPPASRP